MVFDTDIISCFSPDYATARRRFRAAAEAAGLELRSYVNPNRGPSGEDLATDTVWAGPQDAEQVLVMISATHGVEGFCGSGAQLDWLTRSGHRELPKGVAALVIHAINPHGFAWLRRVTEEGVDLNRNWVDFSGPLPDNPGFEELREAFLPRRLSGPVFDNAEAKIAAWRQRHGETAFQIARGGGQYSHPEGMFFGGSAPTWARRTLEAVMADYELAGRRMIGIIDFHTGLGPFGYGEPICGNHPGTEGHRLAKHWIGQSLTEPALGTSASVPKVGLSEFGWTETVGDRHIYVALEFGTYSPDAGRYALRADHWLHAYGDVDWESDETRVVKRQLRNHYYPETPDWQEMMMVRSRMITS